MKRQHITPTGTIRPLPSAVVVPTATAFDDATPSAAFRMAVAQSPQPAVADDALLELVVPFEASETPFQLQMPPLETNDLDLETILLPPQLPAQLGTKSLLSATNDCAVDNAVEGLSSVVRVGGRHAGFHPVIDHQQGVTRHR